jgi:hypothetical protein
MAANGRLFTIGPPAHREAEDVALRDRADGVGVGCRPVEVTVGRLHQARATVALAGGEAVQQGERARGSDLEDRVAVVLSAAPFGSVEVAVASQYQGTRPRHP